MSYADNAGKESSSTYRELSGILLPLNRSIGENTRPDVRCFIPQDDIAMHWATNWLKDWELEQINGERVRAGYPELTRLAYIGGGQYKRVMSLGEKIRAEHEAFASVQAPQEVPQVTWYQE
jgi:hypothetical protein